MARHCGFSFDVGWSRTWFLDLGDMKMIYRQNVISEGIKYVLLYKSHGAASKGWGWVEAARCVEVPPEDVNRLRDALLAKGTILPKDKANAEQMSRLYKVLVSMGALPRQIQARLGIHPRKKCVECSKHTTSGYEGPRCEACHEQHVRTGRARNASYHNGKSRGASRR
jgi:hypothetical protein